jgi:hypothetical protein
VKKGKNMARELIKEKIKQIITTLKKKSTSWSDLKKVTGLPDKTLDRYLDYIEYWGLAGKSDAGWQWFENIRTYETEHDYDLAMNHSRKLLDTLRGFFPLSISDSEMFNNRRTLPVKINDELILCDMAREHLKTGYPKIFNEIVVFEELIEQRSELEKSLEAHNMKIDKDKIVTYVANFNLLKQYIIPKNQRKEVGKLVNIIGSESLTLIEKAQKNYTEGLIKTSNELRQLVFTVEHGEPLNGNCQLCPKTKINQVN